VLLLALHLWEENCDPFALPRSGRQLMIVKPLQFLKSLQFIERFWDHGGTSIWQPQEVKPLRKPQREHSSSALNILRPATSAAESFPKTVVGDEAESASAPITTLHDGCLTVFAGCLAPTDNCQSLMPFETIAIHHAIGRTYGSAVGRYGSAVERDGRAYT
jgi:hypothetical protein